MIQPGLAMNNIGKDASFFVTISQQNISETFQEEAHENSVSYTETTKPPMKAFEWAQLSIERSYRAMKSLTEQTVGVDAGSGEIHLDHFLAVITPLPTLVKALNEIFDYDYEEYRRLLKEFTQLQWTLEDQLDDLIKAIDPEILRAEREYLLAFEKVQNAALFFIPKNFLDSYVSFIESMEQLKQLQRIPRQLPKLNYIAKSLASLAPNLQRFLQKRVSVIEEKLAHFHLPSRMDETLNQIQTTIANLDQSALSQALNEHFLTHQNDALKLKKKNLRNRPLIFF